MTLSTQGIWTHKTHWWFSLHFGCFILLLYTCGVPGQKWAVIRNEWVRLQLVYNIEFRHMPIHQMDTLPLPDPHMYVCLSTHTPHSPSWLPWQPPREPFPNRIFPPREPQLSAFSQTIATLFQQNIELFSQLWYIKAFLRPFSQFNLWQLNDQTIYCMWGSWSYHKNDTGEEERGQETDSEVVCDK